MDAYLIPMGKPEGNDYLEDLDVDGTILLKLMLERWEFQCGLDSCGTW
jgi:hypothetical protein